MRDCASDRALARENRAPPPQTWHWSGAREAHDASSSQVVDATTASRKTTFPQPRCLRPPTWFCHVPSTAQGTLAPPISPKQSSTSSSCGVPSRFKGEIRVVPTATCAPRNSGRPCATTSRHRSKSQTISFVVNLDPASRHTRAVALSNANKPLRQRNLLGNGQGHQGDGRTGKSERKVGVGATGAEEAGTRKAQESIQACERNGRQRASL